ncbi:MAG: protein-disulfide isomerase [Geobacteraceae bacterium GWC2_55_20]|nr:MAG: protein-disulfide isomerase [Geobacteraceae bacterium GWC2_55_20]OGU21365.1 MAG: protein-disulfide isomerase [Geobacteraceae bacterium GWF2_54_21]HBA71466.1 protein-disulfide isomerase [Geobacter sp.]HCE67276.1 protein-disulfide isomerase [Geobacter sp.]
MRTAVILMILAVVIFVQAPAGAADLDLGKSITIGNGPKTVIEFTDPDCPFCRKASKYFESRRDVTRHVFFFPLPRHLKAKEKVQYILSQPDRAGAYQEVMSGRMDSIGKFERITHRGIKLQEEQLEIAKRHKIDSTPTFMINGRIIEGFDLKRIEEALGQK